MYSSVYDLKAFYNTRTGRVVRRVLQERIRAFWPDVHGLRLMGAGYSVPYLRIFKEDAERVFAVMPRSLGAHHWPQGSGQGGESEKNCVCLSAQAELPIETNSVDRVLAVHDLEFSEAPEAALREIWRVLKSNGRLLVLVPNRAGLWAHADWSPFGHGRPYSAMQISHYLKESLFVQEQTAEALFMPPARSSLILKSAGLFERTGMKYFPIGAGIHMVESSKQLYAPVDKGRGSKAAERVRSGTLVPRPAV